MDSHEPNANEETVMVEQWVISYEYRSDNGPRDVGPFPSRKAAEQWANTLLGADWSASFDFVPLTPPEFAGRSPAVTR